MSLSNALSNALSGLGAAARGTEVVASNLANAATPGFARRELQLTSRPVIAGGGGVQVEGVARVLRNSVVAQGRLAEAEAARAGTLAAFHKTLSDAVGVPGEAGALATALSDFDSALVAAGARPESETGLARVVSAARTLAGTCNALGARVQEARGNADRAIAADVDRLNTGLARVADLNRQIAVQMASGGDANALWTSASGSWTVCPRSFRSRNCPARMARSRCSRPPAARFWTARRRRASSSRPSRS
nr:flagellar basal body protein [Paracoccus chinensis]